MRQTLNRRKVRAGSESPSMRAWILAASLGVVYLVNMGFPMYGGSVANTYMTDAMDLTRSTLGAGFSLFTLCQGLSGIPVLLSINRIGVRWTLLLGSLTVLSGAVLMRYAVSSDWQYVVVYGVVLGLGTGFGTVLPVTSGVTLWFGKRRALVMALVLTAGGIGGLIAAPLVDRIVTSSVRGWQAGWESVALAATVSCLATLFFVRERSATQEYTAAEPASLRRAIDGDLMNVSVPDKRGVYRTPHNWQTADALRNPALWLFALGSLGFSAPFMLCIAHSSIHLRDLGIAPSTASMALGLLTVFSIAGRLAAGFYGDRIEPRFIWSGALFLLAGGCLAIIRAHTMPWVLAYTALVGVGFGAAYVCRPIAIGNYFGTAAFASINGILGSLLTLFSSAAPYLGGVSYDTGSSYAPAFIGVAVLAAVAGLGLLVVKNPGLEPRAAELSRTDGGYAFLREEESRGGS